MRQFSTVGINHPAGSLKVKNAVLVGLFGG